MVLPPRIEPGLRLDVKAEVFRAAGSHLHPAHFGNIALRGGPLREQPGTEEKQDADDDRFDVRSHGMVLLVDDETCELLQVFRMNEVVGLDVEDLVAAAEHFM